MGAPNILGLLMEITADPSKAQEAIERFNSATGESLKKAAEGTEPLDKALLSNRESVRLLSEELGVHMPRAVSSALAKMLPDIAALGGALLGIYAAKELYDGIGKFTDWIRDSFTEQTADAKAFSEAAAAAYKAAGKAAEEAFTKFKTVEAGTFNIAEIDAKAHHLADLVNAYHELTEKAGGDLRRLGAIDAQALQTIADGAKEGITSVEQAQQKLAEAGQLQFDARKHMAEVTAKEEKDSANESKEAADEAYRAAMAKYEANQRAFHASEEALKRQMEMQNRLGKQAVEAAKHEEEAAERASKAREKLAESLKKQHEEQTKLYDELGREEEKEVKAIERLGETQERQMLHGKAEARQRIEDSHNEAIAAIQSANQQAQAIAALKGDYKAMADAAIAAYTAMRIANANYEEQLKNQAQTEKEMHEAEIEASEAKIQGMGAELGTFVGAIAGRKAEAEVEGAFMCAEGAFDIARAGWPPNPALLARGIGEIGAGIQMLEAAGKGGGRHAGAEASAATGGVGVGDRSSSHGGGGGAAYDLPGAGPSSARAGTTVTLQVMGDVFGDNLQRLSSQLGQGIQNGSIRSFPATQSPVTKGMM
jgi:actin-related protein